MNLGENETYECVIWTECTMLLCDTELFFPILTFPLTFWFSTDRSIDNHIYWVHGQKAGIWGRAK